MATTKNNFLKLQYSPYKEMYQHILLDKRVKWSAIKQKDLTILKEIIDEEYIIKLTTLHPRLFLDLANEIELTAHILKSLKKKVIKMLTMDLESFLNKK